MNELWVRQSLVIVKLHSDRLLVGAGIEFDLVVPGEVHLTESLHAEKVSKWRHRTGFASWKTIGKLTFACKAQNAAPNLFAQHVQICYVIGGKNGHDQPVLLVQLRFQNNA